jgi:hypothetical protein
VGQVLAADLDEVADFAVWVFYAGAAVGDVDECVFGCFEVFVFDCAADVEHEVGGYLFDLVFEGGFLLAGHGGKFVAFLEGEKFVDVDGAEFLHLEYIWGSGVCVWVVISCHSSVRLMRWLKGGVWEGEGRKEGA